MKPLQTVCLFLALAVTPLWAKDKVKKDLDLNPVAKPAVHSEDKEVRQLHEMIKICEIGSARYRIDSQSDEFACIEKGKVRLVDEPAAKFKPMGTVGSPLPGANLKPTPPTDHPLNDPLKK